MHMSRSQAEVQAGMIRSASGSSVGSNASTGVKFSRTTQGGFPGLPQRTERTAAPVAAAPASGGVWGSKTASAGMSLFYAPQFNTFSHSCVV